MIQELENKNCRSTEQTHMVTGFFSICFLLKNKRNHITMLVISVFTTKERKTNNERLCLNFLGCFSAEDIIKS